MKPSKVIVLFSTVASFAGLALWASIANYNGPTALFLKTQGS